MTTDQLIALITAITALVGAIGGIVAIFRHATGPAHKAPPLPTPVTPRPPGYGGPQ